MSRRIIAGAFALLVALLLVQECRLADANARAATASAKATRTALEAAGWGTVTVTRYVAGAAPELEARARDAEAAGATIAGSTRVEGEAAFAVPREILCPGDAPPPDGAAGGAGATAGAPVDIRAAVDAQGVLARDPGGGWWYDAAAFVTLRVGAWERRERAVLSRADVRLAPELERAWRAYERGGPRNELALGIDTDGRIPVRYTRWFGKWAGAWGEYRHPLTPGDGASGAGGVSVRW